MIAPIHAKFIIVAMIITSSFGMTRKQFDNFTLDVLEKSYKFCRSTIVEIPYCVDDLVDIALDEGDFDRAVDIYVKDLRSAE